MLSQYCFPPILFLGSVLIQSSGGGLSAPLICSSLFELWFSSVHSVVIVLFRKRKGLAFNLVCKMALAMQEARAGGW
jgi:hypothetical protein